MCVYIEIDICTHIVLTTFHVLILQEAAQDAEPKEEKTETLNPKPSLGLTEPANGLRTGSARA